MERIVYKINSDSSIENDQELTNILSNLNIIEYLPIIDSSTNSKLIVNKIGVGEHGIKLYVETSYLKVMEINNNKLFLKLPESHYDFFNQIDDKCTDLLADLVNGETKHDIAELYGQIDLMNYDNVDNFNSSDIEYKSLVDENSDIIKINIFSNTTIKRGNKVIDLSEINTDDEVRLVLGFDYISLLVDTSRLIARTKIYSYFIDVNKKYAYVPQIREKINKWEFSPSNNLNIFIKTNTTADDNFDVNTETCDNVKIKLTNSQKLNIVGGNKQNEQNEQNEIIEQNKFLDKINEYYKCDEDNENNEDNEDNEDNKNNENEKDGKNQNDDTSSSIGEFFKEMNNDEFIDAKLLSNIIEPQNIVINKELEDYNISNNCEVDKNKKLDKKTNKKTPIKVEKKNISKKKIEKEISVNLANLSNSVNDVNDEKEKKNLSKRTYKKKVEKENSVNIENKKVKKKTSKAKSDNV